MSSQTVVCLIKRHKALGRCSLPGFVSRALCCLFVQLVEKSPLFSPRGKQRADAQRQDCPCILAATKPSYTCQGWHGMEWQVFHGRESWRQTSLPFPFFFSSAEEKMCFSQLNSTFLMMFVEKMCMCRDRHKTVVFTMIRVSLTSAHLWGCTVFIDCKIWPISVGREMLAYKYNKTEKMALHFLDHPAEHVWQNSGHMLIGYIFRHIYIKCSNYNVHLGHHTGVMWKLKSSGVCFE